MNIIHSYPISELGYNFIDQVYIPEGESEYYLRDRQNRKDVEYRNLSEKELQLLQSNRNVCDNWQNFFVSGNFNPHLVKNCKFYGLVRLGSLEPLYREFHNFRMPVGLYNSTIISSDLGDNICIDNVNYLSHYIIANDVMIANVHEIATTDHSKFGNGILKDGEDEKQRMIIEVCNENGGRPIIPFNGMLAGDVYMWSKYRDDEALLAKFTEFTEAKFDKRRGYYGMIGERTVIKNCGIIKDVLIGTDAYIKGANKLKNITINSDADRVSQIGEGCELVNGIVGYGCRIFYGVKAVRFITASHSQLKYGARLINSYLGNNSTISCCEVLNSLIFPAHEQHHNNSFLCASLVMGQSNIAAGATIGSNHNSRSADGEIVAGRGFWPGLCVSLKHNSKFAAFTIIAKGDFPAELNIPVPFCLISNDVTNNQLLVMPAYWFMYNMYALARNAWKYEDRDKRIKRTQHIEYDYLAPDTINDIFDALLLLETLTPDEKGEAFIKGWENAQRQTKIIKVSAAISVYREMINLYACLRLLKYISNNSFADFSAFRSALPATISRSVWCNIGGQLILETAVNDLRYGIKKGKVNGWNDVHAFYQAQGENYTRDGLTHAYTSLLELLSITPKQFDAQVFRTQLEKAVATRTWITKNIYDARAKDYSNPYRKMIYENNEEMLKVLGKLEDNGFIQDQVKQLETLKASVKTLSEAWGFA